MSHKDILVVAACFLYIVQIYKMLVFAEQIHSYASPKDYNIAYCSGVFVSSSLILP